MESTPEEPAGSPRPRKGRRSRPATPPPDPDRWISEQNFRIESRETRMEIAARLNAERAKLEHEQRNEREKLEYDRRRDFALFLAVLLTVAVATVACLYIVLSNAYPPAVQNSAMALLAVIVSGGVGYATGKSSK